MPLPMMGRGLAVELIDDAEIARVTYLCVRPLLENESELRDAVVVVAEQPIH